MRKFLKPGFVLLSFIIVPLVVSVMVGSRGDDTASTPGPEPGPPPTPTPIQWTAVAASEILATYARNEIAGKQQFADKPLEVTGRIGRPDYALFSRRKRYLIEFVTDDQFSLLSLDCTLPVNDASTDWVAQLAAGDIVTARGYIRDNMTLGSLDLEPCEPMSAHRQP